MSIVVASEEEEIVEISVVVIGNFVDMRVVVSGEMEVLKVNSASFPEESEKKCMFYCAARQLGYCFRNFKQKIRQSWL